MQISLKQPSPDYMFAQISCPECDNVVDAQARQCEICGVDLGIAALYAESNVKDILPVPEGVPVSPEVLIPRLGDYLIEKGVLNPEDLQSALTYQRQKSAAGQPCLIGQALIELGLIDRATLDQAVTEQIFQLQTALQRANRQLEQRVQERTQELQQALQRLTELSQLKSNFISNISHELRTPLTHIKGYLDLLSDSSLGELNPQQNEAITVLQRSESRLERLIDDLIQFSLAARGELSVQLTAFDLGKLAQATAIRMSHKARANQVHLQLELPENLPFVLADEEKIGWVMMQLVDNAVKFTPAGGYVTFALSCRNGLIRTAVSDNGIGIPQNRIAEIFESFHQLDGSNNRRYSGTGLGLSMVRRILEAHGTQINVHSSKRVGSSFEFSLPIAKSS